METHTAIGERICAPLKSFRNVLPIIRWHHERQDGSGYPDRLRGHQIPLVARVLQTVDVYDALTTDRPYRKALSSERAFGILRDEVRRGWWDGKLVDEFERLLKESPEARARQAPVIQPHSGGKSAGFRRRRSARRNHAHADFIVLSERGVRRALVSSTVACRAHGGARDERSPREAARFQCAKDACCG